MTSNEAKLLLLALSDALNELENEESIFVAECSKHELIRTALNEAEALTAEKGPAPRYGVSYTQKLRKARQEEKEAYELVLNAKSKIAAIKEKVTSAYNCVIESMQSKDQDQDQDQLPALCLNCIRPISKHPELPIRIYCRCGIKPDPT